MVSQRQPRLPQLFLGGGRRIRSHHACVRRRARSADPRRGGPGPISVGEIVLPGASRERRRRSSPSVGAPRSNAPAGNFFRRARSGSRFRRRRFRRRRFARREGRGERRFYAGGFHGRRFRAPRRPTPAAGCSTLPRRAPRGGPRAAPAAPRTRRARARRANARHRTATYSIRPPRTRRRTAKRSSAPRCFRSAPVVSSFERDARQTACARTLPQPPRPGARHEDVPVSPRVPAGRCRGSHPRDAPRRTPRAAWWRRLPDPWPPRRARTARPPPSTPSAKRTRPPCSAEASARMSLLSDPTRTYARAARERVPAPVRDDVIQQRWHVVFAFEVEHRAKHAKPLTEPPPVRLCETRRFF